MKRLVSFRAQRKISIYLYERDFSPQNTRLEMTFHPSASSSSFILY